MATYKIVFVRHGESSFNSENRYYSVLYFLFEYADFMILLSIIKYTSLFCYPFDRFCGWVDPDLSALGVEEAAQAGKVAILLCFYFLLSIPSISDIT